MILFNNCIYDESLIATYVILLFKNVLYGEPWDTETPPDMLLLTMLLLLESSSMLNGYPTLILLFMRLFSQLDRSCIPTPSFQAFSVRTIVTFSTLFFDTPIRDIPVPKFSNIIPIVFIDAPFSCIV